MTRVDIVIARVPHEEGSDKPGPFFLFNDKTGHRITCKPTGNATVADFNLENGLPAEVAVFWRRLLVTQRAAQLRKYAWYPKLDEPRGAVFLDFAFNAGVHGEISELLHIPSVLHYASIGDWANASKAFLELPAAKELPNRYGPLAKILETGVA